MARRDLPTGFEYDPRTRGAINSETGATLSRRQVEKARIAKETGTTGSFEAKARKARLMAPNPNVTLPRKLRRRGALHGYRVHALPEVFGVISALPAGAEVYVKARGHSNLTMPNDPSPRWRQRALHWFTLSRIFRAEEWAHEYPDIAGNRAYYADIRDYDIIVRAINP